MSISSEVLVESRTMRSQFTDRFDVLDKAGSLSLLPDNTHATTEMVARFYEVDVEVVKKIVQRNREELESNGYRVLRGQERRSEEHTSELQSRPHLVCRLLLEKKKKKTNKIGKSDQKVKNAN